MMTTITTHTAVLYARVSSKDQEREGFSIPAQQKLLRQYAHDQQLTILREFMDVETAQTGRTRRLRRDARLPQGEPVLSDNSR